MATTAASVMRTHRRVNTAPTRGHRPDSPGAMLRLSGETHASQSGASRMLARSRTLPATDPLPDGIDLPPADTGEHRGRPMAGGVAVVAPDRNSIRSSNSIGRTPELAPVSPRAVYRRERQLSDTCPLRGHVDCVPRSGLSPRSQ